MLIRPRVMAMFVAVCVLAPMTLASVAQAHRGHFRRHGVFGTPQVGSVCAQVGVNVGGHAYGFKHDLAHAASAHDPAVGTLSETQTKELTAACEKLATASGVKHTAVEAASKTFWEALKADHAKLDAACPALTEHHEHGFWEHNELSPACQEALKSFWAAAKEAGATYRTAVQEACKTFHAALTEFEESIKPILATLVAAQAQHHFFHSVPGPGCPGQEGPDSTGPGHDGPDYNGSGPHGYGHH